MSTEKEELTTTTNHHSTHQEQMVDDNEDEFEHIITDGLPPELVSVTLELAKQVASLGKHLTEQDVEETSHRNDPLYREFLKAGAAPNPITGEMQITLGQFHRHLRSRKLSPTERLQGIVDDQQDSMTMSGGVDEKNNTDRFGASSPISPSSTRRRPLSAKKHRTFDSEYNSNDLRNSSSNELTTKRDRELQALCDSYLNFNQVSALIRHHTGGPQKRLRAATFSSNLVQQGQGVHGSTAASPTTVNVASRNRSMSISSSKHTRTLSTASNNNTTSNDNQLRSNPGSMSFFEASTATGDQQQQQLFMQQSMTASQSNFPAPSSTVGIAAGASMTSFGERTASGETLLDQQHDKNEDSRRSATSSSTAAAIGGDSLQQSTATMSHSKRSNQSSSEQNQKQNQNQQQQRRQSTATGTSSSNNNDIRKLGASIISNTTTMHLRNEPSENYLPPSKEEIESHQAPSPSPPPVRVNTSNNNNNLSPEAGDDEYEEDEDEEFFLTGGLNDSTTGERKIGHLSRQDKLYAKIERISQSPQRVHGGRSSDSVVPNHLLPKQQLREKKRKEKIAAEKFALRQQQFYSQMSPASSLAASPAFHSREINDIDNKQQNQEGESTMDNNNNNSKIDSKAGSSTHPVAPPPPVKTGYGFLDSADASLRTRVETPHKLPDRPTFSPRSHRSTAANERYEAFLQYSQRQRRKNENNNNDSSHHNNKSGEESSYYYYSSNSNAQEDDITAVADDPNIDTSHHHHQNSNRNQQQGNHQKHHPSMVAKEPISFQYYRWFEKTNKTLPESAVENHYYEYQQQQKSESATINKPKRTKEDFDHYRPTSSASMYEHEDHPEQFLYQQQQNQKTRPTSPTSTNTIHQQTTVLLKQPRRPTSALSFVSSNATTSSALKTNHRQTSFRRRPHSGFSTTSSARSLATTSRCHTNNIHHHHSHSHHHQMIKTHPHIKSLEETEKPFDFENYCAEHSKDLPSTTLIPEQNDFVFAKLHVDGPSYVVPPGFEKRLEQKKRELLEKEEEEGQPQQNVGEDFSGINIKKTQQRRVVMVMKDDYSSYKEYFNDMDDDDDENEEDHQIEKAFASRNNNSTNNKQPISPATNLQHEQARIRDDDTTVSGLAKMMRAHIATRKIQRWFRALFYLRRDLSIRFIQRICRGYLHGRLVVAKFPIYSEVYGRENVKVSRAQFFIERIQRVGRGFLHSRKRLHIQYEHETFDRTIGRFAAQMGLRACLATKSSTSSENDKNNKNFNNNITHNTSSVASPGGMMDNFWNNVVIQIDDAAVVYDHQNASTTSNANNINNTNTSFALDRTPSNVRDNSSNNKTGYNSFRQLATMRRQDSLAALNAGSSRRKPEEVRLKYATTSSSASVERKGRSNNVEQQEDANENDNENALVHEEHDEQLFDTSPFFSKKRLRRNQEEYERLLAAEEVETAKQLEAERRRNLRWNRPERAAMPKEENQADADILSRFV